MMSFSEFDLLAGYSFVNNKPVLVDVGAHHGSFSRLFASRGWQVIAFEPEIKNRKAFERNLNGFKKVSCIAKAVSDAAGQTVPFFVSDEHYGIHSLKPWHKTHRLAYEVETVRLDDTLAEMQISSVTLLKIDTEGADFLALKGFDFSQYSPEIVMIEFMDKRTLPNFQYTYHDVVNYMNKYDYTAFVSEWAPIKEYGREGLATEPHTWIRCIPYSSDHKPVWGNLIFVPKRNKNKFHVTLKAYLKKLKKEKTKAWIRNQIKKIPGAKTIYNLVKQD